MDAKRCGHCRETKPVDEFWRARGRSDGYRARCKACERASNHEYNRRPEVVERRREHDKNRVRVRPSVYTRKLHLWRRFKLTPEAYEELLKKQGGGCAVCGSKEPGGSGAFHVDHDHTCCPGERACGNCNRGLLCVRCNIMLGYAKDDPDVLRAACNYLSGVC